MAAKNTKTFQRKLRTCISSFVLWRYTLWLFEIFNTQQEYSMSANIFSQSLGAKLWKKWC